MKLAVRLVDFCRRRASVIAAVFLLLTAACVWYTAADIRMDTDTDKLLSADLPWKRQEAEFDRSFPQLQRLLVAVIDAATPDRADDAAAALVARLQERPSLFRSVRRADSPFLRQNGMLFLEPDELQQLSDKLIEAQPLIGALAADPSPRGLFSVVNMALEGARLGQFDIVQMAPLFDGLSQAAAAAEQGRSQPLSWHELFTGRPPTPVELRRFVLIQPVIDFDSFSASGSAVQTVRLAVHELGLTPDAGVRIRLTGNVAMEEEEFDSVARGTEVSAIVSFLLVAVILFLCLRSARLIVPILLTLASGLAATFAFAVAAVGTLNPISIAFAVLFIGMAVDFGIQVATRYRDRRHALIDPRRALIATARSIAAPLILAAVTTAAGFLAFLPTDFVGVSQLGLIAGAGMIIAVIYNLTLLPALLVLFKPPAEADPVGYGWLAPADRFLARNARRVVVAAAVAGTAGALALPSLRFDFNPMNLRDPSSEAVALAFEMMADRDTTPFTVQVMTASPDKAKELAEKLEKLPQVFRALSISSFVPENQSRKLAILADLNLLLGPSLNPEKTAPPPTTRDVRSAMTETVRRLRNLSGNDGRTARLADRLDALLAGNDVGLSAFGTSLTSGLPGRFEALAMALSAGPVTLDSIPQTFERDWVTPDGRARVEVSPAGDARDPAVLIDFVRAVRTMAPEATGTAVTIQESARVIVGSFERAGAIALAVIVFVLMPVLKHFVDVALVLAPLALATLLTAGLMAAGGLAINFANIIALPLLMGISVAFAIYYVVNHRSGQSKPLQSSTTRAVFFSAATTAVSFGSLGMSAHLGTASMGILLLMGLMVALASTFVVLPALLALTMPGPAPDEPARAPANTVREPIRPNRKGRASATRRSSSR